jgi:hypothetical protein
MKGVDSIPRAGAALMAMGVNNTAVAALERIFVITDTRAYSSMAGPRSAGAPPVWQSCWPKPNASAAGSSG